MFYQKKSGLNLTPFDQFRPPKVCQIAITKQCDLICNRLVANQPPNFLLIHLLLLSLVDMVGIPAAGQECADSS